MDSDNEQKIDYDDDGEHRISSHVCDNLAIDRYYNSHQKSRTHKNNFWKRQQINNTIISTSQKYFCFKYFHKLNIKTNSLEKDVKYDDSTKKQNTHNSL